MTQARALTTKSVMKNWIKGLTGLAMVALCVAGCSRERSRAISAEEAANDDAEGPRDYREMLARARSKKESTQVLGMLQTGIQRFQLNLARLPTNLAEVLNLGFVKEIPDPPPGQAYSYDPVHGNVSLVEIPDSSGIQLPPEATEVAPVRLQDVNLPSSP